MIRNGFKVVFKSEDGPLTSISGFREHPLIYKTTRWTKPIPAEGPLAVFERLEEVLLFCRDNGVGKWDHWEVWTCKYEPSTARMHPSTYAKYLRENAPWTFKLPARADVRMWSRNQWGIVYALGVASLPYGTILASRVKLIERVKSEEELLDCVEPYYRND